jgi:inosine-uridine nucleoside N-ribohydrolase
MRGPVLMALFLVTHPALPAPGDPREPRFKIDADTANEVLLAYLDRMDLPHPRGAHARLFDWGEDLAQHSAAADFLIDRARHTPAGEKPGVIVLGASTNVASALLIAPDIRWRIRVFMLGTGDDAA